MEGTEPMVKLGLAFYGGPPDDSLPGGGPVLTDDNLVFARQLGVTHIIQCAPGEHLLPIVDGAWQYEDLLRLRQRFEAHGLVLHAIENWHAVRPCPTPVPTATVVTPR